MRIRAPGPAPRHLSKGLRQDFTPGATAGSGEASAGCSMSVTSNYKLRRGRALKAPATLSASDSPTPQGLKAPAGPTRRRRGLGKTWAALLLFLLACALYWAQLLHEQSEQLLAAQAQTRLRAAQLSRAMASQVDTQVAGLDYLARTLAQLEAESDPWHARRLQAVRSAMQSFPEGSLVQIAVADAAGQVVYSSQSQGVPRPAVSIADREHFRVHTRGGPPALFISHPVLGRISGRWTLQFTYPVLRQGRFGGVVVLSVPPSYLSGKLREALTGGNDVALLAHLDGVYLARSRDEEQSMDRSLPASREFLTRPERHHGEYQITSGIDGIERFYAWQRLPDYPVVVSVGLEKASALAGVHRNIRDSLLRNGLSTLLLLASAAWIAWLFARVHGEQQALQLQHQRHELALEGGALGAWELDLDTSLMSLDARLCNTLGLPSQAREITLDALAHRVEPAEWARFRTALDSHLQGNTERFEQVIRVQCGQGMACWIQWRGRCTLRGADGSPQRVHGTAQDISLQREAEMARHELQQRLSKLMAQVPGVVYQYRIDGRQRASIPYASPGIERLFGVDVQSVLYDASRLADRIHPDDRASLERGFAQSARDLTPWHGEYRVVLDGGGTRWLAGSANPEREPDGGTLWHGYSQDVTDRHEVLEALRQSEQRLRLTVAAVRDGLWSWDSVKNHVRLDARCMEILDHPAQSRRIRFEAWADQLHPEDREHVVTQLQGHLRQGKVFGLELRMRTAAGEWRWVELRGRTSQSDHLPSTLVIGTLSDISQRMAEAQLRRALLDNAGAILFIVGQDRRIQLCNQRAVEAFSSDGLSLVGRDIGFIHPDQASYDAFGQQYPIVSNGREVQIDSPLRVADGSTRWFSIRGTLLDPRQAEGALIWTLVDTTEHRMAEQALGTARSQLLEVIRHFPGGVLVQAPDGSVLTVNPALCDLIGDGCTPEELIGMSRVEVRRRVGRCMLRNRPLRQFMEGQLGGQELELPDGRTLNIEQIRLGDEEAEQGWLWIVQDITRHRRREKDLRRLAATDSLTGLSNRGHFIEQMEYAVKAVESGEDEGCFLMLDLDHFKHINDSRGHAAGDTVLIHFAQVLKHHLLRESDLAGRLGGEEFGVLLPQTTREQGVAIAERLRAAVADSPIDVGSAVPVRLTVSIGVTLLHQDSTWVLARADAALYRAKHQGRNQVVFEASH